MEISLFVIGLFFSMAVFYGLEHLFKNSLFKELEEIEKLFG